MSGKEQGPAVTTPEDAAFLLPPPTYEEVMGVYQTSIKGQEQQQGPDLPPLAYIDIMPRCLSRGNIKNKIRPKFETFSSIMEGANRWLQDNPGYRVWKCESIERKLDSAADGSIWYELTEMLHHEAIFGYCVYIRGVRLWLTNNNTPGSPPQLLGVRNEEPVKMTIELPTRGYYRRGRIVIGDEAMFMSYGRSFATFCGLQETITHINKRLTSNPIPGSILTIETDSVKAFEGFAKDLDPEATCWSEDRIKFRRITQVVRIFYVQGQPTNEEIALQDFEPELTDPGDTLKPPKFAPFENTMEQINRWLPAQQGIRVVNLQQYDAKVSAFLGSVTVSSDSTDETVSFAKNVHLVRVLRVFYVKSLSYAPPPTSPYVTSRVFLPARTGKKSFEGMIQTMDRIDAWLQATGVPIYNVETVRFLFSESHKDGTDVHRSDYHVFGNSGKHWISAVRVYFPCGFIEPDPSQLPPLPVMKSSGSSSCTLI